MRYDAWQEEVLKHKGDLLLCTGRRVGKTTIFAIKAARRMIEKKIEVVAVSLTEDQAKVMHSMVLNYFEKHHNSQLKKRKSETNQSKITLKNGSTYIVRPVGNTGDAIRGFNADILIVDEASRIPKSAWIAARPTLLTTGGEIWLCSTPFGKEGYFWESFKEAEVDKEPDARYRVFYISSEDVIYNRPISISWSEERKEKAMKNLEKEKKEMSKLEYGQEYQGLFMEDLQRLFPDELLEKVQKIQRGQQTPPGTNFLGVDIARMGDDKSAFTIISKVHKMHYHIHTETTEKTLTYETEDKIIEMTKQWKPKKIGIDAGSGTLGVSVLDHLLLNDKTKWRIEALNKRAVAIDKENKKKQQLLGEDMYLNLLSMIQHKEIAILNDDNILNSLRSVIFEYVKIPNQKTRLRVFSPRHEDSDIVESMIRAAWLAKKEKVFNMQIYSIKI